ncbi:fam11a b protein [Anaeramoeba ignava]|uniref:Fam11a b protein n=1 Tax=Anaeramoeba ignava TaxID=1746090 RepID=A0A9Q0R9X8_ANAIG|nr:fam11a b protein [Anaeramoeba ignava]
MMRYIQSIPNPGNELISKSKLIDQKFKERKQKFEELRKNQAEMNRKYSILRKFENLIISDVFFFIFCVLTFLILLSVYVDANLSSNPIYILIPLFIPILIFSSLLLLKSFYDFDYSKVFDRVTSGIAFLLFIQILMIGLKSGKIIQISWLFVLILILIFVGILVLITIGIFYNQQNYYNFFLLFTSSMIFLFFIFLGLKLDGTIKQSYFMVFSPLFLVDLVPCFICVLEYVNNNFRHNDFILLVVILSVVLGPFIIFEILIFCYLQFSGFKYISFTFIPFYLEILVIGCCLLFSRSFYF